MPDWRVIGGDAPWIKANEIERAQALEMVRQYAEGNVWTVAELAEVYGCTEWRVRQAKRLGLVSGLLEKAGGGGYRATRAGVAMIEKGDG